jgi:hypothetical protein
LVISNTQRYKNTVAVEEKIKTILSSKQDGGQQSVSGSILLLTWRFVWQGLKGT